VAARRLIVQPPALFPVHFVCGRQSSPRFAAVREAARASGTRAERHPQGCALGRGSDLHSIYAAIEQVVAVFQLAPYEVEKEIAEREKGKAVAPM
jgi:hypothetical protein